MNFAHTQDQLDLRDGAQEYLRGRCTVERLRELRDVKVESSSDLGMWSELAELGLLGFLASEENGGLGMDAVAFALTAEQAGYVAMPEPMIDIAGVSVPVLNALGQQSLCEEIIAGETRVLPMHSLNPYVNQLFPEDKILVLQDDQIRLVEAALCELTPVQSIDPLRKLVRVDGVLDGDVLSQGDQALALSVLARQSGALYSAAELLGLTSRMINMATEYAKERQQFGKPIGSYQAVKHHLATALVGLEFARPIVYRASADLLSCRANVDLSIAHAKIAATDAAIQAAEVAIQVHGGMGYTFEVDLHMWMKRSWALAGIWGDRHHHMNVVDRALFSDGQATGPSNTFTT